MRALFINHSTILNEFFSSHPALYVALCLLSGIGIFYFPWLALLCIPLCISRVALLIPIATIYAALSSPPQEILEGPAYFAISSVKKQISTFSTSFCYSGTIRSMCGKRNSHARIFTKRKLYSANTDYIIPNATLSPDGLLASKEKWIPQQKTFSFAEIRYRAKTLVKKHLRQHHKKLNYHLLAALATGDVESRELRHQFTQLGLAHIIAISGFHFALLAALFALVTRAPLALIALLSLYAFYIGPSPSLARAHIAISLILVAKAFTLKTTPLNALGVAMMISLILDPLIVTHIGWQLSFAATLSILLFYKPAHKWMSRLLPVRTKEQVKKMSLLDKQGYIASAAIRKALSLNIAVHTLTLPLLLYHFQTFPLLSLLYNLFIPLLIIIPLTLLFIPFVSGITNAITSFILMLTTYPPKKFAFELSISEMSKQTLFLLLFATLLWGIYLKKEPELIPFST